ncbi:MAG: carboxypeptidase-like regulatory domain-containing protein, partial [Owenweeksia sp.]
MGTFSMALQGGMVLSDLPYSKLYVGTANLTGTGDKMSRLLNFADRNSFETMYFNEFLSDRYVQVFLRQDFKSLLFRRKNFAPHVELVTRAVWGSLDRPELHRGLDFKTLENGYYESGLELNKLSTFGFIGLGAGFYYRYGAYSKDDFMDNAAIKLTSKFSF